MPYQDLINSLKKINRIEDMTDELAQEILLAGITAQMSVLMRKHNMGQEEAFDASRTVALKCFDMILMEMEE